MNEEPKQSPAIEVRSFVKSLKKISGRDANGKFFSFSEPEAIAGLQSGNWTFHMQLKGRQVPIVVAADVRGNKFLAARVDGNITDDLLQLPEDASFSQ
jgi:hypothetical protein